MFGVENAAGCGKMLHEGPQFSGLALTKMIVPLLRSLSAGGGLGATSEGGTPLSAGRGAGRRA